MVMLYVSEVVVMVLIVIGSFALKLGLLRWLAMLIY